ncbi:uncharacterized protein LOC126911195 [Spodoptera frugiperda]|uniref:Uncharacterized protein LOC126911195 n=1 Tax=Spodoptera frugiperda TaxID=7108 RepID=A0A9R0EWE3_SPOFR|nr:uncharacterized protein LOC126911195 [Spodoptera frugiperda]
MAADEPTKHVARKRARAVAKPSPSEAINMAVREMKYGAGKGSSLDAMETYIGAQYKVDAEMLAPLTTSSDASAAGAERKALSAAAPGPPAKMAKSSIAKGKKAKVPCIVV